MNQPDWERFKQFYWEFPALGLRLDLSRTSLDRSFFSKMEPAIQKAFVSMAELERGAIANPDENRMVGHYWLRNASLAPSDTIRSEIERTVSKIKEFAAKVHDGTISGANGHFENLLLIGIGGSALGPQFVADALGHPKRDELRVFFFDNTDPDGFDKVLAAIGDDLGQTLCLVISKSGGTKETRNGMLIAAEAYGRAGLTFAKHAVAVTGFGSELDRHAVDHRWLDRFPMWDWVGGRTSETSAVGLLPAALQGISIDDLLGGAAACDEVTRGNNVNANPSALIALAWYYYTNVKVIRDMVVLPYKDRLQLASRYLQQLIMESIGKEKDLSGKTIREGITVYGNKGSTDQHAFVQQLRDGTPNFFLNFIRVLKDSHEPSFFVESNVTSGDYLDGFFLGTREALFDRGRESITITVDDVSPFGIGMLIALFERAVGFYAGLTNINAYHQPGVEAGKKAATSNIELQRQVLEFLGQHTGSSVLKIAESVGAIDRIETIFHICEHLAANADRGIRKTRGKDPFSAVYEKV